MDRQKEESDPYDMRHKRVGNNYSLETPEAKARWFQSLSLSERMDLLVTFTDLILENNPQIAEIDHAQPTSGRVQILRREER